MATELRFPVEIDDGQAAKELDKLENRINKLRQSVEKTEAARAPLVEQLKEAQTAADDTAKKIEALKEALASEKDKLEFARNNGGLKASIWGASQARQKQITEELAEQESILQAQNAEVSKLQAKDDKLHAKLQEQTAELERSQERAGELTKTISGAAKDSDVKALIKGMQSSVSSGVKGLVKYGIGIRSLYVLFRKLKQYTVEAVRAFAESDPETKKNIDELKASLSTLKASWGAAFAPVLNAVVPILKTLIDWLITAANAVAQFFAVLTGKSSYKKAVASTGELSDNLGSAADNAKEAKKQLMGIDTLTVMQDNTGSSGGGSGGGGSGFEYEEVPVDLDTFTGQLALSFKDVLLDWDNLTGEQIAEKIIAGLGALAGGVIGFMIGGVPGAIKGTLTGLSIGLLVDSLIFDHDGTLSANEIFKSLLVVLGALAGGAIGFMIGGVPGAALGAVIGVALALAIRDVGVEAKGTWDKMTVFEKILTFLGGLLGGLIGFAIGGVPGAILGAAIGIGLMLEAKNVDMSGVDAKLQEGKKAIKETLADIHDSIAGKWEEIKATLATKIDGIKDKFEDFKDNVSSLRNSIVTKFESLKGKLSEIVERIKGLFNFQFQLPALKLPHIQVQWQAVDSALAKFLGITALPHLSVNWYAKGGIVDGATLIGAGEAGKEAIVPLERNTQWVNMVARELADLLFDRDIFTEIAEKIANIPTALDRMTAQLANIGSFPTPAVAGGYIVPPNAVSGGGGYGASPELESKIDALLERLAARPIEVHTTVELDKRKVGESMYTYTEERNRGRGK